MAAKARSDETCFHESHCFIAVEYDISLVGGPITGNGVIATRIRASGNTQVEIIATNEVQGIFHGPLEIQTAIEI